MKISPKKLSSHKVDTWDARGYDCGRKDRAFAKNYANRVIRRESKIAIRRALEGREYKF